MIMRMMKKLSFTVALIAFVAALLGFEAPPAHGAAADIDSIIAKLEKAITQASKMYDNGQLVSGRPYVVHISPKIQISFAKETYKADLKRAFDVYSNLMDYKKKSASSTAKRGSAPKGRLGAMMRAERQTEAADRSPKGQPQLQYDVYADYNKTQQARIQQEDQAVNADLRAVLSERQAADAHRTQKLRHKQQLQVQALKWQAELDKQASQSATAAAKWKQEHSFGAYAKRFLGSVLQTTIGSFTTAFLTPVTTNLANQAVKQMFPNVSASSLATQAAANATQSTITGVAGAAGQTAGQAAVGAVTGQGATQATGGAAPTQPINPDDIFIPGF